MPLLCPVPREPGAKGAGGGAESGKWASSADTGTLHVWSLQCVELC